MEKVWAALPEARMVGGAVRDMLAGRAVADVDFASPLTPQEVMARAKALGLKAVATGAEHGTVTLVAAGRGFEVTTLRRDVETDGRHAVVAFTDDWREDAARRDFTINAMSCTQGGEVFDYFGGRADLAAGIVRFVGDAADRIAEDYLRVLRFFRFFARYGQRGPDEGAVAAIAAGRNGLRQLSVERVWSEVKKILAAPAPLAAVELMRATGVLEIVLPGADVARLAALLERGAPVDPLLRVAALTDEDLALRLRLSSAEAALLAAWRGPFGLKPEDDDAALRRALADEAHDVLIGRAWLWGGDGAGWAALRARLAKMERPVFPLQGRDLAALGVKPGPEMGEMLAEVRRWWMEGGCVAGKEECLARVRAALSGLG
ncbi:MAG: CCA tRNA nucleotidyltransferase [Proteobacteria bacterium]|nr:CCA tRNA nucleotidyltransferase [Pseudomonadota bacterium]MBU6425973.1 CCA tRNA nucleotidyltransferase [Rhodospirillales bacterium]